MTALDEIVKAYDLRGVVPDQFDTGVAHAVGVAFARFAASDRVLVARDMRPSGVELVEAFTEGVLEQGVDVVDLGLGVLRPPVLRRRIARPPGRDVHRLAQPG